MLVDVGFQVARIPKEILEKIALNIQARGPERCLVYILIYQSF